MFGDGVQHDRKSQDMATHIEDHENQLRQTEHLTASETPENLASVGHAMDTRMSLLKLANDISGICGNHAHAQNDYDSTRAQLY